MISTIRAGRSWVKPGNDKQRFICPYAAACSRGW